MRVSTHEADAAARRDPPRPGTGQLKVSAPQERDVRELDMFEAQP